MFNPYYISMHSLNNSKSKQLYSFPIQTRFKSLQKSNTTFYYNLPSMLSNRKAFIGYGKRSDFTKISSYGDIYNIKRLFDKEEDSLYHSPHYDFGVSRDKLPKTILNNNKVISFNMNDGPGPASYEVTKYISAFNGPKYTMNKRYPTTEFEGNKETPGPAYYNVPISLNKEGKYINSKFSNTSHSFWSLSKMNRFKELIPENNIHIFKYDKKKDLNKWNFNSVYVSSGAATIIGKYKSIFDIDNKNPGPGAYNHFSIFGNNYDNYRKKNKIKSQSLKISRKNTNENEENNFPSNSFSICKNNKKLLNKTIEKEKENKKNNIKLMSSKELIDKIDKYMKLINNNI